MVSTSHSSESFEAGPSFVDDNSLTRERDFYDRR